MSLRMSAASEAISSFLAYSEIASSVEIVITLFQPPRKDKSSFPELMLNMNSPYRGVYLSGQRESNPSK